MISQGILIGITIGVFFAGIGIGYTIFQSSQTTPITSQQMQQMMNDPEQMMKWMANDPKHIEQMSQI
ncbi:MAG: hypothetical protein ACE5RL_08735, partial [Nitrosarchaeum sp.]